LTVRPLDQEHASRAVVDDRRDSHAHVGEEHEATAFACGAGRAARDPKLEGGAAARTEPPVVAEW
jgi:hypothetical protein